MLFVNQNDRPVRDFHKLRTYRYGNYWDTGLVALKNIKKRGLNMRLNTLIMCTKCALTYPDNMH